MFHVLTRLGLKHRVPKNFGHGLDLKKTKPIYENSDGCWPK